MLDAKTGKETYAELEQRARQLEKAVSSARQTEEALLRKKRVSDRVA